MNKTSYFTFGQIHTHSINGHTLDKNCIVKITDKNPRGVMVKNFGQFWANEYSEEEVSKIIHLFPRGVYDLSNNKWIKK